MLGTEIDDDVANVIVAQLLFLESEDPDKDINIYINSPGGSVTAGLAIYDTMQYVKPPVSTICVGQAASMGAVLLLAGAKGKRYALPNARIMIHQPLGGARGQATRHRDPGQGDPAAEGASSTRSSSSTPARRSSASRRTPTATTSWAPARPRQYGIIDEVVLREPASRKADEKKQ